METLGASKPGAQPGVQITAHPETLPALLACTGVEGAWVAVR